jgi:hypothetical protein
MAVLQIGRIGAEVDLSYVSMFRQVNDADQGAGLRLEGALRGSTLAETNLLRHELLSLAPGSLVPITYTADPEVDAFYLFRWADLEGEAESGALSGRGWVKFIAVADLLGHEGTVGFRSSFTGASVDTDYTVTPSAFFAAPVGFTGMNPKPTSYAYRATPDGTAITFVGIDRSVSPFWSVAPASFYGGAVTLTVDSHQRSGIRVPNTPTDWVLSNGTIRISYGGAAARLIIDRSTGASWTTLGTFEAKTSTLAWPYTFEYLSVLRNTAHEVTIRLQARSETVGGLNTLDLTLRRGARHVAVRYSRTTTTGLRIYHNSSPAYTADATAGYIHGNGTTDWTMGCPNTMAHGTTYINRTGSEANFWIGWFDGTSNNGHADVCAQFHGWATETIWPVLR